MSESSGARAALKAQITKQIVAQTGDEDLAALRAHELIEEKREKTRAGMRMLGITIALAGLSYLLHLSSLVTFGIACVGCLWTGFTVSGAYFKASAKDLAESITTLGGAIKRVRGGDTPTTTGPRDPGEGTEPAP